MYGYLQINKDRDIQTSVQAITMLVNTIERNQAQLIDEIEQKQEVAKTKGDKLLKELEQEISELQGRSSELQHLQHSENPLYLIQVRKSCPIFTFSSTLFRQNPLHCVSLSFC